jgi:SAM-dependent methyltransferase
MPEPTVAQQWQEFWSGLDPTGVPPWDTAPTGQTGTWFRRLADRIDPTLPIVDVACGNGNQTRWMAAQHAMSTYGIDVSSAAIARAQGLHNADDPAVDYRVGDILDHERIAKLSDEVGPANVFARFLLHHLRDTSDRTAAIRGLAMFAGRRGRIFNLELVDPDQDDLAAYAEREPVMRDLLKVGLRPGRLTHTELLRLYHDAGLQVEIFEATTFALPQPRHDGSPFEFPIEWVAARRHFTSPRG